MFANSEALARLLLVLLVKHTCNTLILYSYFHRTFMILLLVSMTFYRYIEKRHSKSFLPYFSTSVATLLKACRKLTAGICLQAKLHTFLS